ncbi:alpha-amylase-like [Mytilus trossulus]|uniref:alpha-amylase-like n=1 Tax=Mytilus trossulus TaxID=6551 RepID=UPI003003D32C
MLLKLKCPTLEERRKNARLNLVYKISKEEIKAISDDTLIPPDSCQLYFQVVHIRLGVGLCILGGTTHWKHPNCADGRHTIVHLFEWKWSDIAAECENFLGPYGYCGVQISPPNENRVVTLQNRPWWERYQPVSYKLVTRSGNEVQFTDMVQRCNDVNVRIYVDAVINHMSTAYAEETGTGTFKWDGVISYPGLYSSSDFNGRGECKTKHLNIEDYGNKHEVRNCRLEGLADLNQGRDNVRNNITKYMNRLISKGVAGFRIDAAKHMWPDHLHAIYENLEDLNQDYFPGSPRRPFIFQEVIDNGKKEEAISAFEYTGFARVTNFIFGTKLAEVFLRKNQAKWLENWGTEWNMPNSDDVVVFIDNHDNQRGHGGGGGVLSHRDPKRYKMATAFMLAHPYGFTRVMSSFNFYSTDMHEGRNVPKNSDQGPPHNPDMSIKDVQWGNDFSCGSGWICEHRWRQIYGMVDFRNVVHGTNIHNWWSNGNYQIAFSRGDKGFIVINADVPDLNLELPTGLPEGTYCDVISGEKDGETCTGTKVIVNNAGRAHFHIRSRSDDPMMAIHIGAQLENRGE